MKLSENDLKSNFLKKIQNFYEKSGTAIDRFNKFYKDQFFPGQANPGQGSNQFIPLEEDFYKLQKGNIATPTNFTIENTLFLITDPNLIKITDLDECLSPKLNFCDTTNGRCINEKGTYKCQCQVGTFDHFKNGRLCINQCADLSDAHNYILQYSDDIDQPKISESGANPCDEGNTKRCISTARVGEPICSCDKNKKIGKDLDKYCVDRSTPPSPIDTNTGIESQVNTPPSTPTSTKNQKSNSPKLSPDYGIFTETTYSDGTRL